MYKLSAKSSRLPGFFRRSPDERLARVVEWAGLTPDEAHALRAGLPVAVADGMIENVVGVLALPLGVAANFTINNRDRLIPMAIEEPSVVAAVSNAARIVREAGGFEAGATEPVMVAQVQLLDVPDAAQASAAIAHAEADVLAAVNAAAPAMSRRGGGARGVEVRALPETAAGPMLVVHLLLDVRDAMGANAVNTVAEAVAPLLERLSGGRAGLRILSNLADRRRAWARCRVPATALGDESLDGREVARGIMEASAFAEADPYRAATHNKGIMNGIDAVALATGNDWRSIEAGAHAWAARGGRYIALSHWRLDAHGQLAGEMELPLAVGIVGGTTQAHPVARTALKIIGAASAAELAGIMAAVGLAQNLAALRALASEGIQRGHMRLHARQVALAAGAKGAMVARIAERMAADGDIRPARARALLVEAAASPGPDAGLPPELDTKIPSCG